jgi:hypothetical protein
MFSQVFSIAGNQAYNDPPYCMLRWLSHSYGASGADSLDKTGNLSSLALVALCGVLAFLTSFYFRYLNTKKRRTQFSEESNALRQYTIYEIGSKHPGM